MACDSADAFAASAFAPTSHGIKSSMSADWRDHAGANQPSSRPRSISRQLRDWSGPYSCPAFRGKCRTRDDSKGRLVVFLVRISKIYTSGIRIRTNQSRSAIGTSMRLFSHRDFRIITFFKIKYLATFYRVFSPRAKGLPGRHGHILNLSMCGIHSCTSVLVDLPS